MPHDLGKLYPTPTGTGAFRALSTTASSATSNTKATIPALTLTALARQFVPETTSSSTGAVTATPPVAGWQVAPVIANNDPGTLLAQTVTVTVSVTLSQATLVATVQAAATCAAFIGNTLLASGSANIASVTTAQGVTITLVVPQTAILAGSPLTLAFGLTGLTNSSATTATTVTLNYTSTGTAVNAGLQYTIQASRAAGETSTTAESTARTTSVRRATAEALASTETPTRATTRPRAVSETLAVAEVAARVVSRSRTLIEALTTAEVVARAFVGTRRIAEATTTVESLTRALIYGRTIREYPPGVDPDYPVTFARKTVTGQVLDHETGKPIAGAAVELYRDRDRKMVQATTSGADGSYSFPRDLYDPETYFVAVQYDTAGAQVHGVSDRGLTPASS